MKFSTPKSPNVYLTFTLCGLFGIVGYYVPIRVVSEVAFELVMISFVYLVFATLPRKE